MSNSGAVAPGAFARSSKLSMVTEWANAAAPPHLRLDRDWIKRRRSLQLIGDDNDIVACRGNGAGFPVALHRSSPRASGPSEDPSSFSTQTTAPGAEPVILTITF